MATRGLGGDLEECKAKTRRIAEAKACAAVIEEARAEDGPADRRMPMHGVPVSVKECFAMKGMPTPLGLPTLAHEPKAGEDAAVVRLLRAAGAVPFARTAVPQLLYATETSNPITGRCANPWHDDLTPGGSSGGEACLVAAGGSVFGVGTDLGGSVRVPAHFCGVSAIKVDTEKRFAPFRAGLCGPRGVLPMMDAAEPYTSLGFFAASAEDLRAGVAGLLSERTLDAFFEGDGGTSSDKKDAGACAWREQSDDAPLRVGFYESDGHADPCPPCRAAVAEAAARLRALGHDVVPYKLPRPTADYVAATIEITAGFARMLPETLAAAGVAPGDPRLEPEIARLLKQQSTPRWVQRAFAWLLGDVLGVTPKGANIVRALSRSEAAACRAGGFAAHDRVQELRRELYDDWASRGLDAVVCPAYALPAPPHGHHADTFTALSNTAIWNMLNGVCGVARTGVFVDDAPWEGAPSDVVDKKLRSAYAATQAVVSRGAVRLPVGVQVVSLPLGVGGAEEAVLRVLCLLEGGREPIPS